MKVTYIKLENVAGIYVGLDKTEIEISFEDSKNNIISIQGPNGVGKALPISTKIPTPSGWKLLNDIVPGDYVFDRNGHPTKVLGIYPQGLKDVWEVEFSYGKKSKCCDEHLWSYLYSGHGKRINITSPLKDIVERYSDENGIINNIRVINSKVVQYDHQDVPIDPYTLGALIGNGCCREIDLTISAGSSEVPYKIAISNNIIAEKCSSENYSYIFRDENGKRIHTKDFFKHLPEIIDKYSYEKFIPEIYLHNSEEVRWNLLKGLIDTDGSVLVDTDRPEKFSIKYSTTSRRLSEDIVYLIRSLGLNATISEDKRIDKYTSGFCAIVHIIGNIELVLDRICSVESKYQKIFNCITSKEYRNKSKNKTNYELNYMRRATKLGFKEEMKCIRVDSSDSLFLTEDFIVTHNTVLLSSISPFASVTSLDSRSTLPYILPKKNGYKEIHFLDGENMYVLKHYFKANKEGTHNVKSYFVRNGEELNENGNVTSFLALVEIHLGLTQEMMRLVRLGTNVDSFISLTPARRKDYIGNLIDEIDIYMKIHKKINDDIRFTKLQMASNNTNLYNCHISDPIIEEEKLRKLTKRIAEHEKERDKIVSKVAKVNALIADNDLEELRRKYQEAKASIGEFTKIESAINEMSLVNTSVDKLIVQRSSITDKKINVQSKINSYRISIDNTLRNIERLEVSIKKITSNNDMQSILDAIASIRDSIKSTNPIITGFNYLGSPSNDVYQMLLKLSSFNQISQMIHTFGSKPIDVYLRLKKTGVSIDKFLKEHAKRNLSRIDRSDISSLLDVVFKDDMIITPNCDTQYKECPYYRFSEVIAEVKEKLDEESYDDETLRYIHVISNNVDNILNEIDGMVGIRIPDIIRDELNEHTILDRLGNKLPFFDLSGLQEFISMLREYELYRANVEKLKDYEKQLIVYKNSGIDNHISEIKHLNESVEFYRKNINTLEIEITQITKELESVDYRIALVTKYDDMKKYRKMFESTMSSTKKILEPLESATSEKIELDFSLRQTTNLINVTRQEQKSLETKIGEYNRLTKEGAELSLELADRTAILDSVSTKRGIPVSYMNKYLGKIQKLANNLLHVIYGDKLQLAKFNVTPESFEIPYIKNGKKIPDVKYASQSEVALITMAVSFALSVRASGIYNILLIDEMDSGLDEETRFAFLRALYIQMKELKAEQSFVVSHNLTQMVNIPMDCIMLGSTGVRSKLQTVIYE